MSSEKILLAEMRLPYISMIVFRVLGPQAIRHEMLNTLEHLLLFQKRKLNVQLFITSFNVINVIKMRYLTKKKGRQRHFVSFAYFPFAFIFQLNRITNYAITNNSSNRNKII